MRRGTTQTHTFTIPFDLSIVSKLRMQVVALLLVRKIRQLIPSN